MTREIPLTRGYVALVDDEDFERFGAFKWHLNGNPDRGAYAARNVRVNGRAKTIWLHREICPPQPGQVVDHINRDPMDNRRANLRACSPKENLQNKSRFRNAKYLKGAIPHRKRWKAYITVDRKTRCIGLFATELEAGLAYDKAALAAYGEFASPNFAPDRDWLHPSKFAGSWPADVAALDRRAVERGVRRSP